MVQRLMHHPHRRRTVVGPRLFDAEILEPVFHVLQTRAAEQFGDAEIKRIGQLFEVIDTDVALAALDGAVNLPQFNGHFK